MDSFYVTLPSNVKNGGTMSHYITPLPYSLELPGKWEVALTEMYIPHSWFNIDESNNTIDYYEGVREPGMAPATPPAASIETNNSWNYNKTIDQPKNRARVFTHVNLSLNRGNLSQAKLPVGYYETVKDIIDAITKSLSVLARQNITIRKNFNGTITVQAKNDAYLMLNENLTQMLGFTDTSIKGHVVGTYAADVKNGMYSALVYSNIVLPQIIGDIQAPVLCVLPIDGKHGKLLVYRFTKPDYVTLAQSSLASIDIDIRTDHGEPIVFQQGKVLCKLHFRPRHQ